MKEFLAKLNEKTDFFKIVNFTLKINPKPKNMTVEEFRNLEEKEIWNEFLRELKHNEELENDFSHICAELGRRAFFEEAKFDFEQAAKKSEKEVLKEIIDLIFVDVEEEC